MNTLGFILVSIVVVLIVVSRIPGLEHFVKPSIDLIFAAIKVVGANGGSWVIWLFKEIWRAHSFLLENLIKNPHDIDPTTKLNK